MTVDLYRLPGFDLEIAASGVIVSFTNDQGKTCKLSYTRCHSDQVEGKAQTEYYTLPKNITLAISNDGGVNVTQTNENGKILTLAIHDAWYKDEGHRLADCSAPNVQDHAFSSDEDEVLQDASMLQTTAAEPMASPVKHDHVTSIDHNDRSYECPRQDVKANPIDYVADQQPSEAGVQSTETTGRCATLPPNHRQAFVEEVPDESTLLVSKVWIKYDEPIIQDAVLSNNEGSATREEVVLEMEDSGAISIKQETANQETITQGHIKPEYASEPNTSHA